MSILGLNQDGTGWEPTEDFLSDQEPSEGDITTDNYIDWFCEGKKILTTIKPNTPYTECADDWRERLWDWMERAGWWPNVWFVSDHGNAHLVDMGRPSEEAEASA